jgi:CubicO group peptidase (beta-lactamase class C family)
LNRRRFLAATIPAAVGAPIALACSGRADRVGNEPNRTADWDRLATDLETRLSGLLATYHVPGLSIALIRDGQLSWLRGFGVRDAESKAPVDEGTIFEAASMSKPVFAYAVLKLCEKGILDLDTPLTGYTPDRILNNDPRLDRITVRHILSHTSGLQDWRSGGEPLAIHFSPGERWLYSGEGYAYLQSVVTHLTGRVSPDSCGSYEADLRVCATDIDEFMKKSVLVPFGMTSSSYVWNEMLARRAARPHDRLGQPQEKKHPNAIDAARYASAGGLHATVGDFARFLIEVIAPKPADDFRLGPAYLAEMLRPAVTVPAGGAGASASAWSLGWQVFQSPGGDVIAHGGDNAGFHSLCAGSPSRKCGYVVMTNGDGGPALIGALVTGTLHDMFEW